MNHRTAVRWVFFTIWAVWLVGTLLVLRWLHRTLVDSPTDPAYMGSGITFGLCLVVGVILMWQTLERLATRSIRDIQEHSSSVQTSRPGSEFAAKKLSRS